MENQNDILLSAIILCYNEESIIADCVLSILNQEFPIGVFEVLVVDGMSTDSTRSILKDLVEKHSNVRVIDNEKRITPAAMNLGIEHARGKYVSILGAHTIYEKDYLLQSVKLFEKHPEISCSGGPIISEGKTEFGKALAVAMSQPIGVGNAMHRFPDYEGYAEGACFPTFKRSVFIDVGYYDERLVKNQDDEFNFRLRKNGHKIYLSPSVRCTYFVRDTPKKLFKQYYNYGFWRVIVSRIHNTVFSIRQLIPLAFYFAVTLLLVLSFFLPAQWSFVCFLLPVVYLLIVAFFSLKAALGKGLVFAWYTFYSILILHFSYALGFFVALFKAPNLK